MTSTLLRPTFKHQTTLSSEQVFDRLRGQADSSSGRFRIQVAGAQAMVSIVESDRHFWSPWLHLDIRQMESAREVFGRFSPHPSIWTGFMFAYLAMAVLTFFSAVLGTSQLIAGQTAWGFWLILIWILVCIALWIASQIGQRLATQQMEFLSNVVSDALQTRQTQRPN